MRGPKTLEVDRAKVVRRTRVVQRITAESVAELLKSYGDIGCKVSGVVRRDGRQNPWHSHLVKTEWEHDKENGRE